MLAALSIRADGRQSVATAGGEVITGVFIAGMLYMVLMMIGVFSWPGWPI